MTLTAIVHKVLWVYHIISQQIKACLKQNVLEFLLKMQHPMKICTETHNPSPFPREAVKEFDKPIRPGPAIANREIYSSQPPYGDQLSMFVSKSLLSSKSPFIWTNF